MIKKVRPTDAVPKEAQWRQFPLNQKYLVSEFGHMTKVSGTGLLRPYSYRRGNQLYFTYSPMLKNGPRTFGCHVIVAITFIGNRPTKRYEIAHYDGDGSYCHYKNLRWATRKSNHADKKRHGRQALGLRNGQHTHPEKRPHGERHGTAVLTDVLVLYIRRSGKAIRALARELNASRATIQSAKYRKTWRHLP